MFVVLTGLLAEAITVEKALELNKKGYAVTLKYGKVLCEREVTQ